MGDRLEMAGHLLLRVGDVVDLLEGKHAKAWVVNQWRKRLSDPFPAPVAGGRSPRFDAAEVLSWLWDRDLLDRDRPEPAWFWLQAVRTLPAGTRADERAHLRNYLAALVTVAAEEHAGGAALGPSTAALVDSAKAVEAQRSELRGLLADALSRTAPSPDVVALLCRTLSTALEAQSTTRAAPAAPQLLDDALGVLAELWPDTAVSHWLLVELVSTLTASWPTAAVLDPACGEALVLAALAHRDGSQIQAVAVEKDREAAATARLRFVLHDLPIEVRVGDAFSLTAGDDGAFDLVVLDPPTGREGPGLSQWLALVDRVLSRTGRAAVALPAGSLRANAAAAEVLHRRQVSAVVLLPPLVRPAVRDAQALVVIEASGACEQVLVVDLRLVRPRHGELHTSALAALVDCWLDDRAGAGAAITAFEERTKVPIRVLDADVVVANGPVPVAAEAGADVQDAVAALQVALAANPGLTGAEKLQWALGVFARKHDLVSEED